MTEADFYLIYEEYSDAIFRHALFRVSNRETAKDLTQETFIKTWQAVEKGQDIENIKAFLYKVASNLIIDHYRKRKEISLDFLKDSGLDFVKESEHNIDFMDLNRVLAALNKLPEKYRQAVEMRYIEDMQPKEIAALLGKSENSVSVQIHRGVEQLKKYLGSEENE